MNIEMDIHSEEEMNNLIKAQEYNRRLLRELDRVCEKYHLKYYVICGTLLGAVRHKSFVPWDDDTDVAMTRHDFDQLKKIAKKEWNEGEYLFVDYCDMKNGAFLDFLTRLVYMGEEIPVNVYRKIRNKGRNDIENHIPLDIYVLENASDDEKKHEFQIMEMKAIYGLCMGHRAKINFDEYTDQPVKMQRIIKALAYIGKCIPLKLLCAMYERVRKKNNKKETKEYILSNGFIFCMQWKFDKKWFGEGCKVEIDGEQFWGPTNYDAYLHKQYGEYMNLPPLEYRHPAHTYGASGIFHTLDYSKSVERME